MRLGLELRREPRFERSYRRHVGDVYHYALGVLSDPTDAEEVTHTTFRNAKREAERLGTPAPDLDKLLAIAHEVCRIRGGHARLPETELLDEHPHAGPCQDAERAISRRVDGRLPRWERRELHRHLKICESCRSFADLQDVQRDAVSQLAATPLPSSLAPKRRAHHRLRFAARFGALAATAALVLALVVSGGLPSPASFIGKDQGPEAEAGVVERDKPDRKFRPGPASQK